MTSLCCVNNWRERNQPVQHTRSVKVDMKHSPNSESGASATCIAQLTAIRADLASKASSNTDGLSQSLPVTYHCINDTLSKFDKVLEMSWLVKIESRKSKKLTSSWFGG